MIPVSLVLIEKILNREINIICITGYFSDIKVLVKIIKLNKIKKWATMSNSANQMTFFITAGTVIKKRIAPRIKNLCLNISFEKRYIKHTVKEKKNL